MYVCQFLKLQLKQITVIEHKINSITPYSTYVALYCYWKCISLNYVFL